MTEGDKAPKQTVFKDADQKLNSTLMTREHENCELEVLNDFSMEFVAKHFSITTAKELQNHAS